jgi:hypothetical protein
MKRPTMGGGMCGKEDLPVLACFSGNDYVDRLYNNGPKKVLSLLLRYSRLESLEEKEDFIITLQNKSKWKKDGKPPAEGFYSAFWKAFYLQVHAPVFHLNQTESSSGVDLMNEDSYYVTLEPLNPLPPMTTQKEWALSSGLDAIHHHFSTQIQRRFFVCNAGVKMNYNRRNCLSLSCDASHFMMSIMVHTSMNTSLRCSSRNWALVQYLSMRNILPRGKYKHRLCVQIADKCLRLDQDRAPKPRKFDPRVLVGITPMKNH